MSELANIPTVDIKGKQYTEVKDRVMFFRMSEQYKGWKIVTEFPQLDEKIAICKASIYDKDGSLVSTGTAMEKASSGFINKESHVENAETSSVGRALGFLGIGIVGGIATADEINEKPSITDEQKAELEALIKQKGSDKLALFGFFKIGSYNEMTPEIFANAIAMLSKKKNVKVVKNEDVK